MCKFYLSVILNPQLARKAVRLRAFVSLLCLGASLYPFDELQEDCYENPVYLPQGSQYPYGVLGIIWYWIPTSCDGRCIFLGVIHPLWLLQSSRVKSQAWWHMLLVLVLLVTQRQEEQGSSLTSQQRAVSKERLRLKDTRHSSWRLTLGLASEPPRLAHGCVHLHTNPKQFSVLHDAIRDILLRFFSRT